MIRRGSRVRSQSPRAAGAAPVGGGVGGDPRPGPVSSPVKVEALPAPAGLPHGEIARAQPATDETVHAIVEREYASVWRFLRRLGVPESDAGDTAQRVFARVLAKGGEVRSGAERA